MMCRFAGRAVLIAALCALLPLACTPGHSTDSADAEATADEAAAEEKPAETTIRPMNDDRSVAQRLQDASLEAQIKQALVRQRTLRPFNFTPEIDEQQVVLRGDVDTRDQRALAERVMREVVGERTVVNEVTVQGEAIEPDESDS